MNRTRPESSEDTKGNEPDPARRTEPSDDRSSKANFYWVIALAALFFLYLFYSVLNHDTVNIHGH